MTHFMEPLPDRTHHHAKALPPKARRVIADLERKGTGDLYTVNVDHLDACQLSKGLPCNCIPRVSLSEKVNGASKLSVPQQQQIAEFLRSGGGPRYRIEQSHAKGCGINRGKDCNCNAVVEFKSEAVIAAETIASAILTTAAAAREQTAAVMSLVAAVRGQTDTLAAAMARNEKITFERDQTGNITSAKIRDV